METRLFEEGTVPAWTTPEWYAGRERAPHLEQPGGHRERILKTAHYVERCIEQGGKSIVDLGAGDGGLLSLFMNDGIPIWGYDLQQTNVAGSRIRGVDVSVRNVVTEEVEWADIVVATEMLEHLIDPHGFVKRIYNSPAKFLVASSPYNETESNHYEFHTWAWDPKGYVDMIRAAGWQIVGHDMSTMCQIIRAMK